MSQEMSYEEFTRLKSRVINKLNNMSEAEFKIKMKAQKSFMDFIRAIFYDVAALLGYISAIPERLIRDFADGFRDGRRSLLGY